MEKLYVQYGCGLCAPEQWENFDVSPTLRVQKIPLLGMLLKKKLNARFPSNVRYGDIVSGLPVPDNSCDGVYCSHTLEHLALSDFRTALANTRRMLKEGGIFRCVVPDLHKAAKIYLTAYDSGVEGASIQFMDATLLGLKYRPKSLRKKLGAMFGNSHHLWMWDNRSLKAELATAGFHFIRDCEFNDCEDLKFKLVESDGRFYDAVAIECRK